MGQLENLPGQRRVGEVTVQSREGHTVARLPLILVRHITGSGFAPFALADGVTRTLHLPAGAAQDLLVLRLPRDSSGSA